VSRYRKEVRTAFEAPGRPVPMYAVYASGPEPMEANPIVRVMKCATLECNRFACSCSAAGYVFYCCPECYKGEKHRVCCDEQHFLSSRRVISAIPPINSEVYFKHFKHAEEAPPPGAGAPLGRQG